jgi:hypothetical protein
MRNRRHRVTLLSLPLFAALGLMAITPVVAQAENLTGGGTRGKITVLGSELLAIGETVTGKEEGTVLAQVPGRNLEIKCPGGYDIEEAVILGEGTGDARVSFLGCKAFSISPNEEIATCKIASEGRITGQALLLAIKHEGKFFVLGEPKPPNTQFALIEFKSGTGCALPLKTSVTGSYSGELKEAEGVELLVTGSQAIQKLLGDKALFGTFEAIVTGSGTASLTGAHIGCKWGVV